jgi:hypothetical protein
MEPLQEKFEYLDCSDYIDWTTLTTLAGSCLKSGKSIIDGISFSRCKENMLQVNIYDIDIEAFKTAIATVDVTEETKQSLLKNIREQRDNLLEETDWMANSDVTMSDDWKTYRQQLRDLPSNTSDPANPTWPTKPS